MTTIAMNEVAAPHEVSSEAALCVAATVSITAPLTLGDVLTGPTVPDGAQITNVVLSAIGLDGERPQALLFRVVCGDAVLIDQARPSYKIASDTGFNPPVKASGEIEVHVTTPPKVPAIGSVTLMVYLAPSGGV